MQLDSPLDTLITAADRALRTLFAPAQASRPLPVPPSPQVATSPEVTAPGVLNTAAANTIAPIIPPPNTAASNASASSTGRPTASGAEASTTSTATPSTPTPSTPRISTQTLSAPESPLTSTPTPSPSWETQAAQDRRSALADAERRTSAALTRVNHSGEIAAQALYHGQALVARSAATRELLLKAAREETDHLAWCETRLKELESRPSLLNPLWYAGSFTIGALAALLGDRTSLSFVVETERQVEGHLDEHLARLPPDDNRSRAILHAMRSDEISHGATAKAAGGAELPTPVRALMRSSARVMTSTAYWV
jgi:ubiquinone biosynthesis monooxygenase Coq7